MKVKVQRGGDEVTDSGEVDELSSEHAISEDRPENYANKPEDSVETDFKETGLPDWLDPIYDSADSGEELMAELHGGDGYDELLLISYHSARILQICTSASLYLGSSATFISCRHATRAVDRL